MAVNLIPPSETVMKILEKTGAYRRGHFVYPNGKHASHYFQMPLAFRFYDNARVLAVGLSRKFRLEKTISSRLPKVAIISPSPGGIPVAFGVREALTAEQIYWTEIEDRKRRFRQYIKESDIHPCIVVDDIIRTGRALEETIGLVKDLGVEIVGIGAIVRFEDSPKELDGIPVQSLVEFDVNFYDTLAEWESGEGNDAEEEAVRY
ncbi:MAG TPA: phosphoribosyltransferase family protein [Pyrinomonadaceae bacterium]|nr:phosphoribosyltransferase family protein [Pyrinomonadaceae bacterium]